MIVVLQKHFAKIFKDRKMEGRKMALCYAGFQPVSITLIISGFIFLSNIFLSLLLFDKLNTIRCEREE
jgi:hypothetical protein